MSTNFEMVREWHEAFGVPAPDKPQDITFNRHTLRVDLIEEELDEYRTAWNQEDLVEAADALADLLYVVYGTAVEHGINIDEVFAEVHRSNMSKLGEDGKPIYREDGKVLKGPNFELPKIEEIIERQINGTPTV